MKIKKSRGSRPVPQQKRQVAVGGQKRPAPDSSSDSSEDENDGEAQVGLVLHVCVHKHVQYMPI